MPAPRRCVRVRGLPVLYKVGLLRPFAPQGPTRCASWPVV